jgi:hypothetical protein
VFQVYHTNDSLANHVSSHLIVPNLISCSVADNLGRASGQLETQRPGTEGTIAKWLRRQIRIYDYLFLFEGAGSNPAGVDLLLLCIMVILLYIYYFRKIYFHLPDTFVNAHLCIVWLRVE